MIHGYYSMKYPKYKSKKTALLKNTTAVHPAQITTDKEPAFVDSIKNALGNDVVHRDNKYMNNRMEQNQIEQKKQSTKTISQQECHDSK